MIHFFSTELAKEIGVIPAVVFNNIYHWIKFNESNDINFFNGKYWTFNSNKAFQKQFEYLSKGQIENALTKLKDCGYIVYGNFNKSSFDRTRWFALGDKIQEIHLPKTGNGVTENWTPIPNINTYINTYNTPNEENALFDTETPKENDSQKQIIQQLKTRINTLFHRRENTTWTDYETARLREVAKRKNAFEELTEIEKLYNSGYKYRRKDVKTFLNNFSGEYDRAIMENSQRKNLNGVNWGNNETNESVDF